MSSCQIEPKCNKVNNPTVLSGGCWHAPRTQPDCPSVQARLPFLPRSLGIHDRSHKNADKKGPSERREERREGSDNSDGDGAAALFTLDSLCIHLGHTAVIFCVLLQCRHR